MQSTSRLYTKTNILYAKHESSIYKNRINEYWNTFLTIKVANTMLADDIFDRLHASALFETAIEQDWRTSLHIWPETEARVNRRNKDRGEMLSMSDDSWILCLVSFDSLRKIPVLNEPNNKRASPLTV